MSLQKSTKQRLRLKGRRTELSSFAGVPRAVMDTQKYRKLSVHAKALLLELCRQHNGWNNGNLCAAWGIVKNRGCGSRNTIEKAAAELLAAGMIEKTEQGGRHRPNLYALTWRVWDDCGKKVSFSPTKLPSGLWKDSHTSVTDIRSVSGHPKNDLPTPRNGEPYPSTWGIRPVLGGKS